MNTLRRILVLAPFALAFLGGYTAQAQQLSLEEISSYLNGLQTAQAEFTQVNADGTISTGSITIKRPGRIRFDYNAPDNSLVLAGGGQLSIFDPRSNSNPEQYPLNRTPLSIILDRNVNLSHEQMVVGHRSDGATTTITAQDPEHPEYGNIQLVFTANPVELRQWIITDNTGSQTTMILGDLTKGGAYSENLFSAVVAAEKWPLK